MQFQKPCQSEAYLLKCWEHKDDSFGLAVWSAITGTGLLKVRLGSRLYDFGWVVLKGW